MKICLGRKSSSLMVLSGTVVVLGFLSGCMGDCQRWETLGGRTICTVRYKQPDPPSSGTYHVPKPAEKMWMRDTNIEQLQKMRRESHLPDLDPLWDSLLKQIFVQSLLAAQSIAGHPWQNIFSDIYEYSRNQRGVEVFQGAVIGGESAEFTSMTQEETVTITIWGAGNERRAKSILELVADESKNAIKANQILPVHSVPGGGEAITYKRYNQYGKFEDWYSWTVVEQHVVLVFIRIKPGRPESWPERPDPVMDKVVEFLASRQ